jgi:hypothetical protein
MGALRFQGIFLRIEDATGIANPHHIDPKLSPLQRVAGLSKGRPGVTERGMTICPLFAGSDRSILIGVVGFDASAVASNDR